MDIVISNAKRNFIGVYYIINAKYLQNYYELLRASTISKGYRITQNILYIFV